MDRSGNSRRTERALTLSKLAAAASFSVLAALGLSSCTDVQGFSAPSLARERGSSADPRTIALEKEAAFVRRLQHVRAIEPVVRVVRQYQGKLPIAVATGAVRPVLERTTPSSQLQSRRQDLQRFAELGAEGSG